MPFIKEKKGNFIHINIFIFSYRRNHKQAFYVPEYNISIL